MLASRLPAGYRAQQTCPRRCSRPSGPHRSTPAVGGPEAQSPSATEPQSLGGCLWLYLQDQGHRTTPLGSKVATGAWGPWLYSWGSQATWAAHRATGRWRGLSPTSNALPRVRPPPRSLSAWQQALGSASVPHSKEPRLRGWTQAGRAPGPESSRHSPWARADGGHSLLCGHRHPARPPQTPVLCPLASKAWVLSKPEH